MEQSLILNDLGEWADFWSANADALLDAYADEAAALKAACDGGLVVGGGAAPLFVVTFSDVEG